ncbi:hypothetical protein MQM1_055 [Aeromonas phage vB_AsaP_MQM1]|nr:hypothetical protein MQM1_055 [Aeromonas phage vB_AsaP_MQM1]
MISVLLIAASLILMGAMFIECFKHNLWTAEAKTIAYGASLGTVGVLAGLAKYVVVPGTSGPVALGFMLVWIVVIFWALFTANYIYTKANGRGDENLTKDQAKLFLLGLTGSAIILCAAALLGASLYPIGVLICILFVVGLYFAINEDIPLFKSDKDE